MVKMVNRAKMSTPTTGTGTLTLGSAITGYQTFAASGVANADVVRYTLEDGAAWEIGLGTYTASGTLLSRTLEESSTGSLLNLSGNAEIFVTAAAADVTSDTANTASTLVARDASGNFSAGTVTADGLTVNADALINDVTVGRGAGDVSTNTAVGASALAANTSGYNNVVTGFDALRLNTEGRDNVAVGRSALYANTTGIKNTAVGSDALNLNTIGDNNVATGFDALALNTTGRFNVAVGSSALYANTTASNNTAIGYSALNLNTTGANNVATGTSALSVNTTGNNNIATGYQALRFNTTGANSVATGTQALYSNTTGINNIATGFQALFYNTTGVYNLANGFSSLLFNTTGNSNVASGDSSLRSNTTGGGNTAVGSQAFYYNTTGSFNVAVGRSAGNSITTGSNNTVIGYNADASSATVSNEITLGNNSVTRFRIPGIGIDWTSADVSIGTLTKTFTAGESSTINLASSVLAPLVTVTKEIPQTGVTSNSWDVNSTTENYTRLDSAYATTLDFNRYDVSSASYTQSFSVAAQETTPEALTFNNDGTKMYITGDIGDAVYEYSLSASFDISSASYTQSFSVAGQESQPQGVVFNTDGTKMFITGGSGDDVNEYDLSVAFDISTAVYSQNFSVSAQDITPRDLAFNNDGTKMFIVGDSGDDVNEYDLSSGFDVSTASYSQNFSISAQETSPHGIAFNNNGTKMFIVGKTGDDVNEYALSTGFDVSSASYSQNFSIAAQETDPTGIAFNADGTKMFIVGHTGDSVYEYYLTPSLELGTGSFASSDIGKTVEANSGKFVLTNTDGRCAETTQPTSYAQVASGDWEMYGVIYNPVDGDLELSGVADPNLYFDITTAIYEQSFSVADQETTPMDVVFNNDGTKLFVVGYDENIVFEYSLSIAFDISTAFFVDSFSVSAQDIFPTGLAFSTDGTKMFVVGNENDKVYEYDLSTGFDVSSAVYSQDFSVSAQDTVPTGIAFNNDGSKMFIVGFTGDDVNEYDLSTGFDISSAVYSQNFSVAAQETAPSGMAFNNNGTKMFITGATGDAVYEYKLETGFDVSTAYFVDSFSVASQDTAPTGIAFNNDGSKMYIVGNDNNSVYQYAIGQAYPTGYQSVHTTASIDSTYWTDINSMTADQNAGTGNIYYAISTDDRTTWTVIDNTDGERDIVRNNAGTWQYNSNSAYASETWVNGSTNNELATLSQSMEGASRGATYDISLATFEKTFSVVNQETSPEGIAFNTDGTKMFVVGTTGDDVNEYSLSIAFDISTAVYSQNFSVAAQEINPRGLTFNNDGTKMFIVGTSGDDVNEYDLSVGFDISSAVYSQNFSVAAQETVPHGIAFNTDGTKMFIVGTTGDDVNEYDLSTGFDVSSASFVDSFSVSAQDTAANRYSF
jgi:sugar lactone lactonase YvrE